MLAQIQEQSMPMLVVHYFGRLVEVKVANNQARLAILSPFVLPTDLVLLFGGEIILNVERLSNLLGGLSLDHIRDRLAANIKESLYVKVICCKDDFKEHFLINLHELLVPLFDVGCLFSRVGIILVASWGIRLMVVTPFDHLLEDSFINVGDWNRLGKGLFAKIAHDVLDQDGSLSNLTSHGHLDAIGAEELDLRGCSHVGGESGLWYILVMK